MYSLSNSIRSPVKPRPMLRIAPPSPVCVASMAKRCHNSCLIALRPLQKVADELMRSSGRVSSRMCVPPLLSECHRALRRMCIRAFCIPLAMYTLADHMCTRDIAYKLSFMMIIMIFCPVYEVDSAGNQPRLPGAGLIVFLVVSGGSCGRIARSFQVCR